MEELAYLECLMAECAACKSLASRWSPASSFFMLDGMVVTKILTEPRKQFKKGAWICTKKGTYQHQNGLDLHKNSADQENVGQDQ